MDISDIDLNLLSREELIDIIKRTESAVEKIQRLEDDGFFDYSIPDLNILDAFNDISFDISLEDALIEEEENDNSKDIEYSQKQLKSIEENVLEIKDSVFSEHFNNFFSDKMNNIRNYLPPQDYPKIQQNTFKDWLDLYITNDSAQKFYHAFLIIQNNDNVQDIFNFIKLHHKNDNYKNKNHIFTNILTTQWFGGYKRLADLNPQQALNNVNLFLDILKADPDLDSEYKKNFIDNMFYSLYETDYYIVNRNTLRGIIFEHMDINDKNLKWGPILTSINNNIRNMTHHSLDSIKEVPQTIIDRMENEIFGFLGERGLLKEWFSTNNEIPELQNNHGNNSNQIYQFINDVKNDKIECSFNNFFNCFKGFKNISEYLLIKREKFIIQDQLDMHKEDTDLRKTKRL